VKLGLLTACLPGEPLDDIAAWASTHGYRALEVAAWPDRPGRDWEASHLDVEAFGAAEAERVRALFARHDLELSAVAYYENNLHEDPEAREATHEHLRRCVDAAQLLGVGLVGTFVGRDLSRTVAENLKVAEKVLPSLVEYAAARGVRLVVENCPMEGWHPDGYPANLAYSPELWDWLAELGLWLNYDPSHLLWQGIDPVAALEDHADRVLHVQAKDVEVDAAARNRFGVFGQVIDRAPWVSGWWRYRIPGLGEVDWSGVVGTLRSSGYDGVVSVEHEDPVFSGDGHRVREGLLIAEATLTPLIHD
jgi:sugar phosphate isomerase/epimerase